MTNTANPDHQPRDESALVVVSFYDRRSPHNLQKLLSSMAAFDAGAPFEVLVVVNSSGGEPIDFEQMPYPLQVVHRENMGMNIGAWDAGWRHRPGHPFYLFLQDECFIIRNGWLKAFEDQGRRPETGLVGESINPSWDASWEKLEAIHAGSMLREHTIDGRPAPRTEVYLHAMQKWGIAPGDTGRHLRSLVWATRREVLHQIDGFPIGLNYGECIAAEIGVGRKIAALGLALTEVAHEPFHYIRHVEWNQDAPGAPFNHASKAKSEKEKTSLRERLDQEVYALAETVRDMGPFDQKLFIGALMLKLADRQRQIDDLKERLAAAQRRPNWIAPGDIG